MKVTLKGYADDGLYTVYYDTGHTAYYHTEQEYLDEVEDLKQYAESMRKLELTLLCRSREIIKKGTN